MAFRTHRRPLLFLALFLALLGLQWQLGTTGLPQWASINKASVSSVDTAVHQPIHVEIPRIGVDASIVPVGLTPTRKMDVPKRGNEVGWFSLGTEPGKQGSAVLAGHLDTVSGPAVFWKLGDLEAGDSVIVTLDSGVRKKFTVVRSMIYDDKDSPLTLIFGNAEGRFLNLITCNGAWLKAEKSYEKRLVVFTQYEADLPASSQSAPK